MSFREYTVAADRGPFGDLTRKITLRKDLRLAEQSAVAVGSVYGFEHQFGRQHILDRMVEGSHSLSLFLSFCGATAIFFDSA